MMTMTDWRTLDLTTGREDIAEGLDPARIRALDEYRRTRGIVGVWLASTAELESADDDESADLGPAVEAIDWTGFDEAHAALKRAVAAWGDRSVRSADDVAAFCGRTYIVEGCGADQTITAASPEAAAQEAAEWQHGDDGATPVALTWVGTGPDGSSVAEYRAEWVETIGAESVTQNTRIVVREAL